MENKKAGHKSRGHKLSDYVKLNSRPRKPKQWDSFNLPPRRRDEK